MGKENTVVNLFGKEVILDKLLIISLDGEFDIWNIMEDVGVERLVYDYHFKGTYAGNYKTLCKLLDNRCEVIVTPLTSEISALTMELGYDIIVQSGHKFIKFSDLLMGNDDKGIGRQVRATQNWEKMLYSNCFDLDIPSYNYEDEFTEKGE